MSLTSKKTNEQSKYNSLYRIANFASFACGGTIVMRFVVKMSLSKEEIK
jgi:hypothetical protein